MGDAKGKVLTRLLDWYSGARLPAIIAFCFTLTTVLAMVWFVPLDDEGYQAFLWSGSLLSRPVPTLFFQKAKFMSAMLALPGTAFGWTAFLIWNKVLAGLGVYFAGRAAQAVGGRGWIGSVVVATSPVFVYSALAGQSNVSGVFLASLALYLLVTRRHRFFTGCLLGVLPWARNEFAVFVLAAALFEAVADDRDRRFFLGLVLMPMLYAACGAIYHHDVMWMLHFPPVMLMPESTSVEAAGIVFQSYYLRDLAARMHMVTPLWPMLFLVSPRVMHGSGKAVVCTLAATAAIMMVLPFWGLGNFGHTSRYWLVLLPFAAFTLATLVPSANRLRGAALPASLLAAGLVLAFYPTPEPRSVAIVVVFLTPLAWILLSGTGRIRLEPVVVVMLLGSVAWNLALDRKARGDLSHAYPLPEVHEAAQWLRSDERGLSARSIYTNVNSLALFPEVGPDDFPPRIMFIVKHGMHEELYRLLNRSNGQYRAILDTIGPHLYGAAAWPCHLSEVRDFSGDVFVLYRGPDLEFVFPQPFFDCYSDRVASFNDIEVRIGRSLSMTPQCYRSGPNLDEPALASPCLPAGGS